MRYEVVSGKEYPVYSRKEADELGLSYKHPFKVSEGITMMVVDPITGEKAKFGSKKTIIEAYKKENIRNLNLNLNNGNLKYRSR